MSTGIRTCIVLSGLWLCAEARAEKAVLECIADTWASPGEAAAHGREPELALAKGGALLLEFRTALIAGWRVEKATLLLHVKQGRAPGHVRAMPMPGPWAERSALWRDLPPAGGRKHKVRAYGQGFVAIDLDAGEVQGRGLLVYADSGAARFDARETVGFSPYLLIEGSR